MNKTGKGQFKKGNLGKPKGTKNKLTIDVQQTAFEIFEKLGDVEGAVEYFKSNKQTRGQFYHLFFNKMLPSNMNVEGNLSISYQLSEKFMPKTDNEKKRKQS